MTETTIHEALTRLIPPAPPEFDGDTLAWLTGATKRELAELAFPDNDTPTQAFTARPGGFSDPHPPAFAWLKRGTGGAFVLYATRLVEPKGECRLIELNGEQAEGGRQALRHGEPGHWYRFIKTLPPSCFVGIYPSVGRGLLALNRVRVATATEHKTLEALALQLYLLAQSAAAAAGLIQALLNAQPVLGGAKIMSLIDGVADDHTFSQSSGRARLTGDVSGTAVTNRLPPAGGASSDAGDAA